MNEHKMLFEIVFHYSKKCNWLDRQIFKEQVIDLYHHAAEEFNANIDDWNKAWNALHPEVEELTEENGWLEKYNNYIQRKMRLPCVRVSNQFGKDIYVVPTDEAWYEFRRKGLFNNGKTCQFSLKPLN